MKKFILTLVCIMSLTFASTSASSVFSDIPENTEEEKIVNMMQSFGIIAGYNDNGIITFKPNQAVSRAELVTMLRNSIGKWDEVSVESIVKGFDWDGFFMGDAAREEEILELSDVQSSLKSLWTDVNKDYWAYEYMYDMSVLGTVVGYPDGTFRPNNNVSYNEAVKVVLSLLGYDDYAQATGGFPTGYANLASELGLNKSIAATGDMPMSRMEVARLIYNAFDLKLSAAEEETGSYLSDIVGIDAFEGVLGKIRIEAVQNGIEYAATIGETEFKFKENRTDLCDYVGENIQAFFEETDDGKVIKYFETIDE